MFTGGQFHQTTWWPKGGEGPTHPTNCLRFGAIAVVAAVDLKGEVVAMHMKDFSIKWDSFITFLEKLKPKKKSQKTFVFLDNLKAHHSPEVKTYAKEANIELLYNAAYSSELNPIERLWLFSKRLFYKRVIEFSDWKDRPRLYSLVDECIKAVPTSYIKSHVDRCMQRMKDDLT